MIILNWTPVQGANAYNIYIDTVQGISKVTSQLISPITNPRFTVSNLQSGTLYYFVVIAVNDNGESPFSSEGSWRAP